MSKFKVGDQVKLRSDAKIGKKYNDITLLNPMYTDASGVHIIRRLYCNGEVCDIDGSSYSYGVDSFELACKESKIVITVDPKDQNKTIARMYDGNTEIKRAEAKCSPSDTYDFNIGATLAFNRLMGTDKPEVKEVKRPAKVGEWIKVLSKGDETYKRGVRDKRCGLTPKGQL